MALAAALLFGCGGNGGSSARPKPGTAPTSETGGAGSDPAAQEDSTAGQEAPSEPSAYPRHAGFSVAPITAGQRSQLARNGQVAIPVRVAGSGTVSAFGQSEIDAGIVRTANAAARAASGAGTVDLMLRLTSAARKALAGGNSLLMYVAVRCSCDRTAQQFALPLGPS